MLKSKTPRWIVRNPDHHFGLGQRLPLRGFPPGEPLIFDSTAHFTRVQILTPTTPPTAPERPSFWGPPPTAEPASREFFVKLSADHSHWEPGEELTPHDRGLMTRAVAAWLQLTALESQAADPLPIQRRLQRLTRWTIRRWSMCPRTAAFSPPVSPHPTNLT